MHEMFSHQTRQTNKTHHDSNINNISQNVPGSVPHYEIANWLATGCTRGLVYEFFFSLVKLKV